MSEPAVEDTMAILRDRQRALGNFLARRILAGEFGPGDTVAVDAGKEGLDFRKRLPAKLAK